MKVRDRRKKARSSVRSQSDSLTRSSKVVGPGRICKVRREELAGWFQANTARSRPAAALRPALPLSVTEETLALLPQFLPDGMTHCNTDKSCPCFARPEPEV